MLSPSARAAKASAFAAASMSASLPWTIGNNTAAVSMRAAPRCARSRGGNRASGISAGAFAARAEPATPKRGGLPISAISGFGRACPAQQAGRRKDENEHEDREDDDVGPAHRDQLAAEGLDQSDQDAADHGAGDAADAAEDGRRERPQPGRVADDKARIVVIEAEDQRR